jgi:UDP-N-acetylglucosamine 2-epimerase (non-hydrolysing)
LQKEGIAAHKVHFVGNTMIDSLLAFRGKADESNILANLGLRPRGASNGQVDAIKRYALLTLHRPANVDNRETFLNILGGLEELGTTCPIIFPVHPRTQQRIRDFGPELPVEMSTAESKGGESETMSSSTGIVMTNPLGYLDFLCLMKHAAIVVTDSGGIQEETTCLKIPCVTVRENTERPVTVEGGTNVIAGTKKENIQAAIRRQLGKTGGDAPKHWDGHAAERIVEILVRADGGDC